MLTKVNIVRCVDLARTLAEQAGPKEAKYYRRNFLSKFLGIYSKVFYPDVNTVHGVEDLWRAFEPRLATIKQKAELLASWVKVIRPDYICESQVILDKFEALKARHVVQNEAARARGSRYQFMDPFRTIARELDSTTLKVILSNSEQSKSAIYFKSNAAALEYAIAYGSNSFFDGAVLVGLVTSVKNLGSLSVIKVKVAVESTNQEDYTTVEAEHGIEAGDFLAFLCGIQEEKSVLVPIAKLEPALHPTEGWKIKSKIH
jgi:hypothetical protein